MPDELDISRQIPHSLEAELGVLGCIMLSPHDCMGECLSRMTAGSSMFYSLQHQAIYESLCMMYERKQAIDVITLHQCLKDRQMLEACGGLDYIAMLPDKAPSAANLLFYIGIVRDKFVLRSLLNECTGTTEAIYEHSGPLDELLDSVGTKMMALTELSAGNAPELDMAHFVRAAIDRMEMKRKSNGGPTGLHSGLPDLDRWTLGLHRGEVTVIAARPSEGKTTLAMNMAEAVALDQGCHVGVFSLEMAGEQLVERMIYSRSRVNGRDFAKGHVTEMDDKRIFMQATKLAKANIRIEGRSTISINDLRAIARRWHKKQRLDLLVVDYLQLLHSTNRKADKRHLEIGDISRGIKHLAKELNVPILLVSQLNREMEREKARRPKLSDLRESGDIEQDAHNVIFIWDKKKPEDGQPDCSRPVTLFIAKQREGPRNVDVEVFFNKECTRFESLSKMDVVPTPKHWTDKE